MSLELYFYASLNGQFDWRVKLNRKPVGNVYFMIQLTVIL